MSGDVYSHFSGKPVNGNMKQATIGRVNLCKIVRRYGCTYEGICRIYRANSCDDFCLCCVHQRKLDIPSIIEEELNKK